MKLGILLLIFAAMMLSGCKKKEYSSGEAVYKGECAKCHKLNGSGGTKGPDLTNIFDKHDEKYVRDYTVDPRSIKPDSVMPPAELDDVHLSMLLEYLKKNARKRPSGDPNKAGQR